MSFLPSFSSLAAPSNSTATSSSAPTFKPATLSYFTIFCPALKPPKNRDAPTSDEPEEHDEDAREIAREAAQILFYTSRARAALKDRMLRQIGVAKGMIEFCTMVSKPNLSSASPIGNSDDDLERGRSWNVHSSKRRMILIEVESGMWVHASIELPYTTRSAPAAASAAKVAKEYHDALLPDAWVEESIRRAWRDWRLLNGCPAHVLSQKAGRARLERSLEKYFSVWAWSWDLELATNADVAQQRSLFTECVEGFPVVARAPRSKMVRLMQSDAAQRMKNGKHGESEMVILSDTAVLWPPTDAGCFDSEDEAEDGDESTSHTENNRSEQDRVLATQQLMDPETKAELLRRVVSHLTGLERERDLIRAASVSSTSDGRKRGTSGAIRERGSSTTNSKTDMRNGLLSASTNKKRVVSSPIMQQRSTSASSYASSTTESTRWSNWGSVFSGLGKLGFRGNGDSSARSEVRESKPAAVDALDEPGASGISINTADLSAAEVRAGHDEGPTASSPIEASANPKDGDASGGEEASSPLQVFSQRLADAIPIQEAGGKMWTGAELAFRGIGASLGLANAPTPPAATNNRIADPSAQGAASKPAQDRDISERDRFADASFDTNGDGDADADASVVTKVSILEPEVDVNELAEALVTDEDALNLSISEPFDESADAIVSTSKAVPEAEVEQTKPQLKAETGAATHSGPDAEGSDPISPTTDTHVGSDAASIRTSASAKAFPSISVTSAAWYNTKALRADPAVTTSSPKLPSIAGGGIFSPMGKADACHAEPALDTSLGGISVQSEHHDFELDGWGYEQPQPFQSFRCFVGDSDTPVSYESLGLLQKHPFQSTEFRVTFTTRRLLTLVLIEKVGSTVGSSLAVHGSDNRDVLDDAWQLLRRSQRILNDYDRQTKAQQKIDGNAAVRFLHLDGPTLTFQSSLEDGEPKMEDDVQVVADAHCVGAMEMMRKHGVVETFLRSSNGKTWTASRQGRGRKRDVDDDDDDDAGAMLGMKKTNQTFMVLAGKKMSIVDCDLELRRLANEYPSFGI
ncbi:uncharacterized protein UTRI_05089_B [Ustilago trichophora]|uniref:CCZ1/INTU/HSP4 first Longin domain-containing protein n=1 Tax=Ustilago trichophora TaxID=86804 RepID=A0A5C3EI08_9BASI|nr:uncharacterized protein UTRI_05089_B [Ustilago trichophora]